MDTGKRVVTIGREYGSGGHEIAKILAEKLALPFYDKEILTLAAKNSGICEDLFEHYDEKAQSAYLLSLGASLSMTAEGASLGMSLPLNHRIFLAQFDAITRIADEGPCLIVGRCADYVLRERNDVINIFLYASVEARIQRIMEKEGLTQDKAKEQVRKVDKQRQNYYNFFADGNWGHRSNYDLMLRTDHMKAADVADVLEVFIHKQ